MIFVFLACCSPAPEGFFSHFWPRSKLACDGWYITKHVWISAELHGGARRIKRRLAGSIWHGIAFRLPETSRSLATTQIVFEILINFSKFLFFFVLIVKTMSATRRVSHRLLCFYRTLSAVAAVEAAVAAAVAHHNSSSWSNIQQQYTSAERHISPRRAGSRVQVGVFRAPKWHYYTPVISISFGMPRRPGT